MSHLVGIELRRVRLPLVEPWRWAGGALLEREVIIVRAVRRDSEGWGECATMPAPTYSPEWTDGAWEVLRRHLVPLALGTDGADQLSGSLSAVKGHHMAKGALELAVLDAELRAAGVSLAARLGGTRRRVEAGVAIGLTGDVPELLDAVRRRVEEGYRRVKLKVFPGWDVKPVGAVRACFTHLPLQVDANATYRRADGPRLAQLDEFDLLCIEQPLAEDDLIGHAELVRTLQTPVCLDESITSAGDTATAIALGACSVINIKPGRVGGYLEAVRIHDLCASRGMPVWCGGLLETGVGRAANLALASLPNFSLPGDLSASDRYYARDITEPVRLDGDGMITVPEGPGTGAVVRPEMLDAVTVERAWLASAT